MDKTPSISNIDYIKSSLDNMKINSEINITKINELQASLDKASKSLIIPILSIQHKLKASIGQYITNYTDIKSKAVDALNQLTQSNDVTEKISMSLSSIQLKQSSMDKHDKMINLYESISHNLSLFNELFKTAQYDKLVESFDNLVSDDDLCEKNDDLNQMEKDIKLRKLKKKKKKLTTANSKKDKDKEKTQGSAHKSKQSKNKDKDKSKEDDNNNDDGDGDDNNSNNGDSHNKSNKKKGKADIELLEIIQKEYPTSAYIQKISRTFLRRRLFKKVIYIHSFNFNTTTQTIAEEKIRSSGDSTIYKYGRFTFDFNSIITAKQYNQAITLFENNLKHSFMQTDSSFKTVVIAGKIKLMLNELLDQVFRTDDLYKEYNVTNVKIEFYEFYEELANEFNSKEKNVKINCDEKNLKQLNEDWKGLSTVREYVENYRKNLS